MKQIKHKMTDEDKEYFYKLCTYIEKNFLGYDNNQHLKKNAVLRIKGLERGNVAANNAVEDTAYYDYRTIYFTFIKCANDIKKSLYKKEIESEEGRVAYMCAIVRNKIDFVYNQLKQADKNANVVSNVRSPKNENDYKTKSKNADNKYEGMW